MKSESITVRKISADEFYIFHGGEGNSLANYYAERLNGKDGILSVFCKGESIGYAIYMVIEGIEVERAASGNNAPSVGIALQYIFTAERHRRRGVAKRLLVAAEELCRTEKYAYIKVCLPESTRGFEYMYPFFVKNNYVVRNKFYLFRCEGDDFKYWEDYAEKRGNRLIRWLTETQGYSAISFDDIGEDVLRALKDSPESDYQNDLQISHILDNGKIRLVRSMSFVAVKDGVPAAYCLVTSPDAVSVVFEQISVSAKHRNAGVILLPFAMAMRKFKELGYKRAAYSMYENNIPALAFAKRFLGSITRHRKIQYTFVKEVQI